MKKKDISLNTENKQFSFSRTARGFLCLQNTLHNGTSSLSKPPKQCGEKRTTTKKSRHFQPIGFFSITET